MICGFLGIHMNMHIVWCFKQFFSARHDIKRFCEKDVNRIAEQICFIQNFLPYFCSLHRSPYPHIYPYSLPLLWSSRQNTPYTPIWVSTFNSKAHDWPASLQPCHQAHRGMEGSPSAMAFCGFGVSWDPCCS